MSVLAGSYVETTNKKFSTYSEKTLELKYKRIESKLWCSWAKMGESHCSQGVCLVMDGLKIKAMSHWKQRIRASSAEGQGITETQNGLGRKGL